VAENDGLSERAPPQGKGLPYFPGISLEESIFRSMCVPEGGDGGPDEELGMPVVVVTGEVVVVVPTGPVEDVVELVVVVVVVVVAMRRHGQSLRLLQSYVPHWQKFIPLHIVAVQP
jgi:hypothetical protein